MYLKLLNPTIACYEINNNVSSNVAKLDFFAQDGDVIENIYSVDTNFINEVSIDTFDLVNKRVAGRFKCSLVKDKIGTGPWYNPDQLILFNGEFHCRIIN